MPLISDLTVGSKPPIILPPLDVEWVWFCHSLNPVTSLSFFLPFQNRSFYIKKLFFVPSFSGKLQRLLSKEILKTYRKTRDLR